MSELWPILFKTGVELGALPLFESGSAFAEVDWLPVDMAAEVVGDVILGEKEEPESVRHAEGVEDEGEFKVFNIVNPHPVAWVDVLKMVQRQLRPTSLPAIAEGGTDTSIKELSLVEWVDVLNKVGDNGASSEKIPALKLLPFFERMIEEEVGAEEAQPEVKRSATLDTTSTRALSPVLEACPSFNEVWIGRSVDWWRNSGFLL